MSGQNPAQWKPPRWDASFGDPVTELDMLRSCAEQILRSIPGSEVELCHVDDGYMYVSVRTLTASEAHIYIVERGEDEPGKWYGVFRNVDTNDEIENYVRTPEKVSNLLLCPNEESHH